MQTPRNPSNTQVNKETAAARKRRPIFTRRIPVRTRTAIVTKEEERRRRDAAFLATVGCRPSAMPQANAAAIATAGCLMALFATSQRFRCEMSVGRDRTDAFP